MQIGHAHFFITFHGSEEYQYFLLYICQITETLQQQRERLSDIIRQEFADRLVLTDEENRRIKGEIAELRARQQLELDKKKEELEALRQTQEKELETIHEK